MNERGQYGNGVPRGTYARGSCAIVGLKLIHTPGDSDRAVRQIDTEMNAIVDAMYRAMGVDPTSLRKPFTLSEAAKMSKEDRDTRMGPWRDRVLAAKAKAVQSPLWAFFDSAVSPAYGEWLKFLHDHEYYNVFTSWDEYEKSLERARQLRVAVKAKGVHVETPEPVDLTKTLGAEAAEGLKGIGKEALKIMKWAAIGVLAIGGVFALTSAASHLRKGTDPIKSYADLARRSNGSRANGSRRALPSRQQLALPPGEPEDA